MVFCVIQGAYTQYHYYESLVVSGGDTVQVVDGLERLEVGSQGPDCTKVLQKYSGGQGSVSSEPGHLKLKEQRDCQISD